MVQAALAAAMMNDDMGACTPKSGWLYSLEFIALLRLQECIAEQASEREGKTQSCGRWSFRFSNQLHGRNTLRSGCRTRERAAGRDRGRPIPCMRLHRIAYRTHAFARYESRKRASHPISATSERVRDHKMRGNRRAENYADLSGGMAAADKSVSLSGGVVRPKT